MTASLPRRRKILYVAPLVSASTSTTVYRLEALRHLGQQVETFDLRPYQRSTRAGRWVQFHYPLGPMIGRINRDLCKKAEEFRPDVVWFDKPTLFTARTMHSVHQVGAQILFYGQDAPFGPRNDGCWRQFVKAFRLADLHCLVREADVARYRAWNLPWIKTMFSFDVRRHFPPPAAFGEKDRDRGISYIGHPHEQRPAFLLKLARDFELPVFINGNRWMRYLSNEDLKFVTLGEFLSHDEYREGIWRSKINLSFVTEDNEDDIAHKAIESAACGGFLLALRTPGHQAIFEEDKEAVFFSSIEECADKARFYLGRPDLREAIAARGRARAVESGYDNDTQLTRILNRLDGKPE